MPTSSSSIERRRTPATARPHWTRESSPCSKRRGRSPAAPCASGSASRTQERAPGRRPERARTGSAHRATSRRLVQNRKRQPTVGRSPFPTIEMNGNGTTQSPLHSPPTRGRRNLSGRPPTSGAVWPSHGLRLASRSPRRSPWLRRRSRFRRRSAFSISSRRRTSTSVPRFATTRVPPSRSSPRSPWRRSNRSASFAARSTSSSR